MAVAPDSSARNRGSFASIAGSVGRPSKSSVKLPRKIPRFRRFHRPTLGHAITPRRFAPPWSSQMVEQSSEPMPEDVRAAFREAIQLYADWKFGGAERALSFRGFQKVSLSGVCDVVLGYRNGPLSENVYDELWKLVAGRFNLKEELAGDPHTQPARAAWTN